MREEEAWWLRAKCKRLDPVTADDMFFPSTAGKKPTRAREFCTNCPVYSLCLSEAIDANLPGFQAGTTVSERAAMGRFKLNTELQLRVLLMPDEPTGGTGQPLRLVETAPDSHAWMDEVEPDDNVLAFLDKTTPDSAMWELAVS